MKNFGFVNQDKVIYIGTNGKMSEMSAAMGLANFSGLEKIVQNNRENYQRYCRLFGELPGFSLIHYDESERNNYQYIIARIDEKITGLHRNIIHKILSAENILVRRYFYPGCHRMEPYKSYFPHAGLLLPVTEKITGQVMSFPNGLAINASQIEEIYRLLQFILTNSTAIKEKILQQQGVTLYGELSESA
jgi:dTDP-4-amino-4,6-dideoxygalactose transaminase